MRFTTFAASILVLAYPIASQQIWDIWQTTWDRANLFSNVSPSTPINFVTPGPIGSADIVVTDTSTFQTVWGYGASLTDSSATILSNLKATNSNNYWALLNTLFNPGDAQPTAGLSYLRVPLGASDFSASLYTFVGSSADPSLSGFDINKAPSTLFSTLQDIMSVNNLLKIHVIPWSPPGWMKDSGSMKGGNFLSQYESTYASYLLKVLQGLKSKGINVYAIGIQNEPENSNGSYPTCIFTPAQEAAVASALRSLMDGNGFGGVKIIGYDHNWNDAGGYPIQIMQDAPNAYAGVAFHCYSGTVSQQDTFHTQYPNKEIYFTECSGTMGSDWWSDIKWYMDNLMIGSPEHNAHSVLMWNLALDGNGNPKLPGTTSCGTPCRPVATVNSDGSYSLNQEYYTMAQASRAVTPRDVGGPWGKRIGVSVGGSLNWALRVGAYVTGRVNPSDFLRYSLVVLNWDDSSTTTWNPQPVTATIEFRGMQATHTFPVGVTTLWWYAAAPAAVTALNGTAVLTKDDIHVEHYDKQHSFNN